MSEQAERFAAVLCELEIPADMVERTVAVFTESRELREVLKSPVVPLEKKHRILEKIFREPEFSPLLLHFLKKVCDDHGIDRMEEIHEAWRKLTLLREGVLEAELFCVTEPDDKQAEGMKAFLKRTYGKKDVRLQMVKQPELIGGFLLKAGDVEYDYSLAGQLKRLRGAVVK